MADDTDTDTGSLLFTVRIWSEATRGGFEPRGTVRAADSGAFRGFRAWSDLTGFLAEQIEEARPTKAAT